jgi:predicted HD superfamily hydrolase involved in NAD metabolism
MGDSLKTLGCSSSGDALLLQTGSEPEILIPAAHALVTDEQQCKTSPFRRKKILDWLGKNVPDKRLKHILRVEDMAIALAKHHHLDTEKAAQAGLMHDLAKFFKPRRLLEMARSEGMELDEVYEANPHLLHADVGAIVARDEFGIADPEVLEAIRNHTLGSPGMSPLSCVVYLADGLEPGRGDTPELNKLRQVSHENLHKAVWLTSEFTMRSLLSSNHLIHPRTVLTRNWALQMTHPTPPKP